MCNDNSKHGGLTSPGSSTVSVCGGVSLLVLACTVAGVHWSTCLFLSCVTFGGHVLFINSLSETPVLHAAQGKFRDFLLKHVPSIQSEYRPVPWFLGGVTSTILSSFIREAVEPQVDFRRELFELPDGGIVALDWKDAIDESTCDMTVLMLAGITGSSEAGYLRTPIRNAIADGARCVVFNNRGMGGVDLATPRTYCAANTEDLDNVVAYIRKLHPNTKILGLGFSMGGMLLTHFISGGCSDPKLSEYFLGAMIVSSPWDAHVSDEALNKGISKIFTWELAKALVETVKAQRLMLDGRGPWDYQKTLQSITVSDFHTNFTVPQFGYRNIQDFYAKASLIPKIRFVELPLLALTAMDDPFLLEEAIPCELVERSHTVCLITTRRGGHLGFLEGVFPFYPNSRYLYDRIFRQFLRGLMKHAVELKNLKMEKFQAKLTESEFSVTEVVLHDSKSKETSC